MVPVVWRRLGADSRTIGQGIGGRLMAFWIVLGVIVGALALLAWWLSGPRFVKKPHEALPPHHDSPGLGHGGGGGSGMGLG